MIGRLLIVGVGLIGGSLALEVRQRKLAREVVGVGRSRANLDTALQLGLIDRAEDDLAAAAREADLIMLALPVGAMPAAFAALAPVLGDNAIVTDAGSTKQDVIAAARATLRARIGQFVPAHPIAGAETSGAAAARTGLYAQRNVILTPLAENRAEDVASVEALWTACGAVVSRMTADAHDQVFAAVSHLPHLAAFALVDDLNGRPNAEACFRFAGAGFRDFTRIAASSPEMWRDVALANRAALLDELDAYLAKLGEVRALVDQADGAALQALFARAREARLNWKNGHD